MLFATLTVAELVCCLTGDGGNAADREEKAMLRLTGIVGHASDLDIADKLHDLSHHGRVESVVLSRSDTQRHRLRVRTDRGTECAVALARTEHLSQGAVLLLEDDRAIVVRMEEEYWLPLAPRDAATALELGYHAGNLHWRVRFDGDILNVALEGPEAGYIARIEPLLADGRVRRLDDA